MFVEYVEIYVEGYRSCTINSQFQIMKQYFNINAPNLTTCGVQSTIFFDKTINSIAAYLILYVIL